MWRGRRSARFLWELEVARRTILRDVDALTEAGLPIVVRTGQRGGIELGFNYRTRLTGLDADEAEAIALANSTAYRCSTRALAMGPASLPNGTVGVAYSQTLTASGRTAPYTWSLVSGTVPAGLTLDAAGVVSGSPTAAGTSTFTARATDSGSVSATRTYSITIVAPPAPGAFAKTAPISNATSRPRNGLVLSWTASTNATSYEYCFDTSNNNTCNATWVSAGTSLTATINGLASRVSYYWQVRAKNSAGTITNANTGKCWKFTTVT